MKNTLANDLISTYPSSGSVCDLDNGPDTQGQPPSDRINRRKAMVPSAENIENYINALDLELHRAKKTLQRAKVERDRILRAKRISLIAGGFTEVVDANLKHAIAVLARDTPKDTIECDAGSQDAAIISGKGWRIAVRHENGQPDFVRAL